MLGIKSPEILQGLSLAAYKKKLANAIKKFKAETTSLTSSGKPYPSKSFAILPAFEFEGGDGETRQVIILGLSTKWVKYVKGMRRAKKEFVVGDCVISGGKLVFTVKRKIRLTNSEIIRENKKWKYNNIIKAAGLDFKLGEVKGSDGAVLAEGDLLKLLGSDDTMSEILKQVEYYKSIDPDEDTAQFNQLPRITAAINARSLSSPNKIQEAIIKKAEDFVSMQFRLIEKEIADEAWEDYADFEENQEILVDDKIQSELRDLTFKIQQWKNLYFNMKGSTETPRMLDLEKKVEALQEEYAFVGDKGDLLDVFKNIALEVTKFKKLGDGKEVEKMEILKEMEKTIDAAPGPLSEDQLKKIEKAKANIEKNKRSIELELASEAWNDYNDFQEQEDTFREDQIKVEIAEMVSLFERWKKLFEKDPNSTEKVSMLDLETKIQVEQTQYQNLLKAKKEEDETLSSSDEALGVKMSEIKSELDEFKKIPFDEFGKRVTAIDSLLKKVNEWLKAHKDPSKHKTIIDNLKNKLEKSLKGIIAEEDNLVKEAEDVYNSFEVETFSDLNDIKSIETLLTNIESKYNNWKTAFENHGSSGNGTKMSTLEVKIENSKQSFTKMKSIVTNMDKLITELSSEINFTTFKYDQHKKKVENLSKLMTSFPS
ncbi:MAG: hypothetical protein AAF502_08910 [Bacteroidota bacterium]